MEICQSKELGGPGRHENNLRGSDQSRPSPELRVSLNTIEMSEYNTPLSV